MKKKSEIIAIEENNGIMYSNSLLKLDHYYYSFVSSEKSLHKVDTNLENYVINSLYNELSGKVLPLVILDLEEFDKSISKKIPILYHENYQLDWMIFDLNSENEITNFYFSDRSNFYNSNEEILNKYEFFEEPIEQLKQELRSDSNSYYHIVKQKSVLDKVKKEMKRSDGEEWMEKNEVKARTDNPQRNISVNFGPIPFFLQQDFVPYSLTNQTEYKFIGMFDPSIFGNLIDAYCYIFYNTEEERVVQYMQTT